MEMHLREQDGLGPDVHSDEEAKVLDPDEDADERNFITRLYEDEDYVREKELLE